MFRNLNIWVGIFIFLLLASGCNNSMDAFNEEEGLYSIYGYLNLYEDINYIRIKDINQTLQDSDELLDAKVTFENLNNNTTEILQDTVVEFDGVQTHNFRTTMDINPDTEYRVTVEDSEGQTTTISAVTPYLSETTVDPIGANCTTEVNINLDPIRSRFALEMRIGFNYEDRLYWIPARRFLIEADNQIDINFTPLMLINETPISTELDLGEDDDWLLCEDLSDDILEVEYTHYGPGIFEEKDLDLLEIPGGTGKFGGFYEDSFTVPINTKTLCPPIC